MDEFVGALLWAYGLLLLIGLALVFLMNVLFYS